MNTINNPLILHNGIPQKMTDSGTTSWYLLPNKEGNQSGKYVDLALAEEMLKELENILRYFEKTDQLINPGYQSTEQVRISKLILKAKG